MHNLGPFVTFAAPQRKKFIQDTNIIDELMFFTPDISSTISHAAPSNINFRPEVMLFPSHTDAFKNVAIFKLSSVKTAEALLHMIVLSPYLVYLDRLQ